MTVAPGRAQAIKRIAVMSAIGDKFTVKKIGFTVFGNDLNAQIGQAQLAWRQG